MFLIYAFNKAVSSICAAIIGPLAGLSYGLALGAISLVTALVALLVFKCCSNQGRIKRAKDVALARILEIRIYKDDLFGIFSAFGRILAATLRYLALCIVPLAVMILPVGLMIFHMAAWFEYRPLQNGDTALVTAAMNGDCTPVLESSSGIRIETDAFVLRDQTATWRISLTDDDNPQWLTVKAGGKEFVKEVHSCGSGRIYPRLDSSVAGRLANPVERPLLPSDAIRSIEVQYPKSGRHWLAGWLVLSLLAGWILKYPLRVEI